MPYRVDGDLTTYISDNTTSVGGAIPELMTAEKYNDLITKIERTKKYTEYIAEHLDKLINDKIESKKEIFMVFYINVDGMSRQRAQEYIQNVTDIYGDNQCDSYEVNNIIIPVKNQPTKVEIMNPSITNGDIIKSFKDLVDTLDDNKYREIIEKL